MNNGVDALPSLPPPFLLAIGFYLSARSIDPVVKLFSTGRMPSAFQPSFLRMCMYICVCDTKERDMEEKVTYEKNKRKEHSFRNLFFRERKKKFLKVARIIIRDIIIFQFINIYHREIISVYPYIQIK